MPGAGLSPSTARTAPDRDPDEGHRLAVEVFVRAGCARAQATGASRALEGKPLFLFPLQLSGDYQIRHHSPFPDMRSAASYVIESFAAPRAGRRAPADQGASVRTSACSAGGASSTARAGARASKTGVHFIDGGDLEHLVPTPPAWSA